MKWPWQKDKPSKEPKREEPKMVRPDYRAMKTHAMKLECYRILQRETALAVQSYMRRGDHEGAQECVQMGRQAYELIQNAPPEQIQMYYESFTAHPFYDHRYPQSWQGEVRAVPVNPSPATGVDLFSPHPRVKRENWLLPRTELLKEVAYSKSWFILNCYRHQFTENEIKYLEDLLPKPQTISVTIGKHVILLNTV